MRTVPRRLDIDTGGFVPACVSSRMVIAKPKNPSGFSGVMTESGPNRKGPHSIRAATMAAMPAAASLAMINSVFGTDFKVL